MNARFRKHCDRLIEYFKDTTYAGEYRLTVKYTSSRCEVENGTETFAKIEVDPHYLWAVLTVYEGCFNVWKSGQYRRLATTICHEFCHVLTEPVFQIARLGVNSFTQEFLTETNERQTQRIANTIMDLTPNRVWMPPRVVKKK